MMLDVLADACAMHACMHVWIPMLCRTFADERWVGQVPLSWGSSPNPTRELRLATWTKPNPGATTSEHVVTLNFVVLNINQPNRPGLAGHPGLGEHAGTATSRASSSATLRVAANADELATAKFEL